MTIQTISELKDYNKVLDNVKYGNPVYLTKNGKGKYAIYTIEDANNYEEIRDLKNNIENIELKDFNFFISDMAELEKKLNKSSEHARENPKRYTHEEIFDEAYRRLNG